MSDDLTERDPIIGEKLVAGDPAAAREWWNQESAKLVQRAIDDVLQLVQATASRDIRMDMYARSLNTFCGFILGIDHDKVPKDMTFDDAVKMCHSPEQYAAATRLMWECAVRDSSLQILMAFINNFRVDSRFFEMIEENAKQAFASGAVKDLIEQQQNLAQMAATVHATTETKH